MAAGAPGLAPGDPAEGKRRPGSCAMTLERANREDRAGGFEATGVAEPGTEQQPIATHESDQEAPWPGANAGIPLASEL